MFKNAYYKGIALLRKGIRGTTRLVIHKRVVAAFILIAVIAPMFSVFMPTASAQIGALQTQPTCTRTYLPGIGVRCQETGQAPPSIGQAVLELGDDDPVKCTEVGTGGWPSGFLKDPGYCILEGAVTALWWLAGVLVEWTATLLDYTLKISVFTNIIDNFYSGLVVGWTVLRDFANLSFIFILIYIGVATMLDLGGGGRQLLAKVIVIALLVNFSFFITRFVIDISNIFAYAIYSSIAPPDANGDADLGGAIRSLMGLDNHFQKVDISQTLSDGKGKYRPLLILTVQALFGFVAAWIFFQAALVIFVRIVAFIYLIVVSPAAFVASILPGTKKYFSDWKDLLIHQSLVAPLFLFLLFVVIKVLSSTQIFVSSRNSTNQFLFQYILAIALLIVAIRITKKYAGDFGKFATGWGNTLAGFALGAATGGVAFVGRQSIGRAALNLAESESLRQAGSQATAKGWMARKIITGSERTSKSTFDARNTATVGKYSGKLGVPLGKGSKSTYSKLRDENEKYYKDQISLVGKNTVTAKDFTDESQEAFKNVQRNKLTDLNTALGTATTASTDATLTPEQRAVEARKIDRLQGEIKKQRQLVTNVEKMDKHQIASEIAGNRGRERAGALSKSYSDGAAPGPKEGINKAWNVLGWSRPTYKAARDYARTQGKDKKQKILEDFLTETATDTGGGAAPAGGAPAGGGAAPAGGGAAPGGGAATP